MINVQNITLLLVVVIAICMLFLVVQRGVLNRREYRDDWIYWEQWGWRSHPFGIQLTDIVRRAERNAEVELTWSARQILILTFIEQLEAGQSFDAVSENMVGLLRATAERAEERAFPRGSSLSLMCAFLSRSAGIYGPRPEVCSVCGRSW